MVRTRFAPSPTGYLHIGGVRTALFNWLFARQHGGQFVLRIDDTDQQRNVQEALEPILDGFRWLGIDWDEGPQVEGPHAPYFQSQRADRYQAAVEQLLERGLAYRDYARPEEVQAEREAAQQEKRSFIYSRQWMAETDQQAAEFESQGRQAVVRLKMPREGVCQFTDLVRGDVQFDWAREQDMVIQKNDGSCLYHLASVVDDHDFGITHVIRAEEHLSNTPRQIFIVQGLGYDLPQYAHLPYVAEPGSKNKLSKRKISKYLKNPDFKQLYERGERIAQACGRTIDSETFNPVIVDFYRDIGFLPDAVINYLLLLGWSLDGETEEFTREQMIKSFSLERVIKSPASFDPQKLLAFQERLMDQQTGETKASLALPYLVQSKRVSDPPSEDDQEQLDKIVQAAGDRLKIAGDILEYAEFYLSDDAFEYDQKAFQKRLVKPPEARQLLTDFQVQLNQLEDFSTVSVEKVLRDFVEQQQIKIGQLIHALRVAVTGKPVGFGLFETLAILGKERCLERLSRTLAEMETE